MNNINYANLNEVFGNGTSLLTSKYTKYDRINPRSSACNECTFCHRKNIVRPYNDGGKTIYCNDCHREFKTIPGGNSCRKDLKTMPRSSGACHFTYSKQCPHCGGESYPMINDGGSVAQCLKCNKVFTARKIMVAN